jgi:hypothetical protein
MSIGRLPAGLHEFGGIRDQCSPKTLLGSAGRLRRKAANE